VEETYTGMMNLYIEEADAKPEKLRELARLCQENNGPAKLQICLKTAAGDCVFFRGRHLNIRPVPEFIENLHRLFGPASTRLKADRTRPEPRMKGNFRRHAQPAASAGDD
jgi:hypothetical protein